MSIRPADAGIHGFQIRRVRVRVRWVRVRVWNSTRGCTRTRNMRVRVRVWDSTRGWTRTHPKT